MLRLGSWVVVVVDVVGVVVLVVVEGVVDEVEDTSWGALLTSSECFSSEESIG